MLGKQFRGLGPPWARLVSAHLQGQCVRITHRSRLEEALTLTLAEHWLVVGERGCEARAVHSQKLPGQQNMAFNRICGMSGKSCAGTNPQSPKLHPNRQHTQSSALKPPPNVSTPWNSEQIEGPCMLLLHPKSKAPPHQ